MTESCSHRKTGSNATDEKKAARRAALSNSYEEVSSSFPCELNLRVAETWKIQEWWTLGYAAAKSVKKDDTRLLRGRTPGAPGQSFHNLEDVINQLPGRDASLSWVHASDGVL